MLWDIAVAVAAGICQLLTAWLGWRITMSPIDPEQKKKRILYEGLFISAGLLGVFFVGLAAYRTPRERAHLAFQPTATYELAGREFSWASSVGERRAIFLQIDMPLAFNLWYENVGSGPAVNIMARHHAFIEPQHFTHNRR